MNIPVWLGWFYLVMSATNILVMRDKPGPVAVSVLSVLGWAYLMTTHYSR